MMISLSIVSIAVAFANLRLLSFDMDFKEPLFAHAPMTAIVALDNKKAVPSYSISLELAVPVSGPFYLPVIKRGHDTRMFNNIVMKNRGRYTIRHVMLKTGFPFIFMYAGKRVEFSKELIVYPEIIDVQHLLSTLRILLTENETAIKGHEGEFFAIREYVYGEESRNIDWKATAKSQKTMIREYAKSDDKLASVILDNSMAGSETAFEKSVSVAASLCSELIERDYYVRLITCRKVVPFGNGRTHLFKMLDILAEIRRVDVAECQLIEAIEGLSLLVVSSDETGFSGIAPLCSGVIDARDI
jgi:uncharacterized protein (DUF58 family)